MGAHWRTMEVRGGSREAIGAHRRSLGVYGSRRETHVSLWETMKRETNGSP